MAITPENIGDLYPTKIPSLEDLSDIQRALRIYHYGAIPGTGIGEYDPNNTNENNLKNPSIAYTLYNLQEQIDGIESGVLQNTIFAAKGDLISASANDTPVILSSGTNNQVLTVNTAAASGLAWADTLSNITLSSPIVNNPTFTGDVPQLGKNILINGSCVVHQRFDVISITPTSTTLTKVIDRFFAFRSSGTSGATAYPIGTYPFFGAPTLTSLPGFPNAIRMQRDSGNTATATLSVGQTVESINSMPFQGRAVTFSFWARKGANFSASSDALQVRVYTGTGTDQGGIGTSYTGTATPISGTATLTTSWQRFSFTGTISSTATQIQVVAQYVPTGTAGANDYFDITGFQLEAGTSVTPFSLAGGGSYQAELDLCRRYFEAIRTVQGQTRIGSGYALNSTQAYITVYFKVPKRNQISSVGWLLLGFLGLARSSTNVVTAATGLTYFSGTDGVPAESWTGTITSSTATFTTGEYVEFVGNNVSNVYIVFNAEIGM